MQTPSLDAIRSEMKKQKVECLVITNLPNITYLTGFHASEEGDGVVLVTPKSLYLFTDGRYQGAPVGEEVMVVIWAGDKRDKELTKRLTKDSRIGFERTIRYGMYERFAKLLKRRTFRPTSGIVEKSRLIKTEEEIALIRKAAACTDAAFTAIQGGLKPGKTEGEVAAELAACLRKLSGSDKLAFDPIVASGINGQTAHAVPNSKRLEAGEFVTIDFGATCQGYHSDMTRTVLLGGKAPDPKMKRVYDVVLEAQKAGVASVKAGVTGKDVDKACRDIIKEAGFGDYFVHGTGHGVGLEIHEAPRLGETKAAETVLKPGMVVTVEPGVYIPELSGVRIEDLVVVREGGCEVLSHSEKELIVV